MVMPPAGPESTPRYQRLADIVTGLLDSGVLKPGMRAPSIRRIAAEHGLSISTVLHAYRLLEDRGILEARPKSGFYVVGGGTRTREAPRLSQPRKGPTRVAVARGVLAMLDYAARPEFLPLGCAIPSGDLLAGSGLDRFLARVARMKGSAYNTYTEPRGDAMLRAEICRRALRTGVALAPDAVAITNGCTEALSLALRAVTRRGDTVAIESPTYFGLLQVLEGLELNALELPMAADTGIDVGALAEALATRPIKACLLSSSFSNPLGSLMSEAGKREVLALLGQYGVPLIEDDIYGDIHFGAERPRPFMALAPDADIISCSSFSKTLAPGYRIGWIATRRYMDKVLETKFALNICSPSLPQAALAEFLLSGGYESHLRRLRRAFAGNVAWMSAAIDASFPAQTRVTRPRGGFFLWLEMPKHFNSRRVFDAAIARGICFAPGDLFSPSRSHANCLRLSCGHAPDDRIAEGIATLGAMTARLLDDG